VAFSHEPRIPPATAKGRNRIPTLPPKVSNPTATLDFSLLEFYHFYKIADKPSSPINRSTGRFSSMETIKKPFSKRYLWSKQVMEYINISSNELLKYIKDGTLSKGITIFNSFTVWPIEELNQYLLDYDDIQSYDKNLELHKKHLELRSHDLSQYLPSFREVINNITDSYEDDYDNMEDDEDEDNDAEPGKIYMDEAKPVRDYDDD
jgi:hypothetical protein